VTAAISLEGVCKQYGALAAVRDVTLELGDGHTVALVGHNGAGKTTLFKLMLGLTRCSAGTLRVLGFDPASPSGQQARLSIGYLPENVVFSGTLTGLETLQFYARLKRREPSECMQLLEQVGLGHALHKRVSTYSKGMRQRLGLAQAVLGAPRLLFLDEPTTGLDPLVRQSFYELLGQLRDRGVTALLSSHALSELEARIDQVIIMHAGQIVASGSLDALRNLAGLPVRIRLTVAADFLPDAFHVLSPLGCPLSGTNGAIELNCESGQKMGTLRRIAQMPQVLDVAVIEPTLDQIYASFLSGKDRLQ
jgi:Cu-processing system ATP-binding protein